ncbi:MAG TPA: cysteine hydrolase [Acidimicrobiales bacterium]|nr:cysteine hydrolase [Acidimicrobiales bacterium]
MPEPLSPERTAVVVVDMVNHQCTPGRGMLAAWDDAGIDVSYIVERIRTTTIPANQRLLAAARAAGAKVGFLRVGAYDAGYDDLTPSFRGIAAWEPRADLWGSWVIDALPVSPGDLSLIKTGSGGFYTSALDSHLRNMGIENVIYTGVITNGCVLLTAAGGMDRGYRGFLASDATATVNETLQRTTERLIDGFVGTVASTDVLIEVLTGDDAALPPPVNPVAMWSKDPC